MKRLYRSRDDKAIAGICGGIGQAWQVDPNIVRVLTVLLAVLTGILPVLIAYFVAWAILPLSPEEPAATRVAHEGGEAEDEPGKRPPIAARREEGRSGDGRGRVPPPGAHPSES